MTASTRIAGLDIETTGLDQTTGHRIIEIAISVYELETQRKLGEYATRINPLRPIDPAAQEVHGISLEELLDKPTWETVAPKVAKLLSHCHYVVAHNGEGFDLPFIFGELIRAEVALPTVGSLDTMLQGRWATPDGSLPSLQALCFASGVPYDTNKAHGAIYDVDVMMQCLFKHFGSFFALPTAPYQYTVPKPRKDKK